MSETATVRPRINNRTPQEHTQLITAAWRNVIEVRGKLVGSYIEVGRRLQQAKEELPHGDFGAMFTSREWPFSQDTAGYCMAIARHPILSNSAHARNLPPRVYTLYLLTRLPDEVLLAMLADGRIHSEIERKDAEQLIKDWNTPRGYLQHLIAKLETVEPAISVNPIIPMLTEFWLTGRQLMAFNDQIAIAVPFATDFKGTVPATVLRLLQAAGFDNEITITSDGDRLTIKNARNNRITIKLPIDAEPEFLFTMPERTNCNSNPTGIAQLIDAIKHCMISVGNDTSVPEHMGVTLEPNRRDIMVYSADGHTISRAQMDGSLIDLDSRVILPAAFCKQMLRIYSGLSEPAKAAGDISFEIGSRTIDGEAERYALFTAGGITLYGRLVETRSPLNFAALLARVLPRNMDLVDIPERFRKAVAMACLVCGEDRRSAKITVRSGQLCFHSQSDSEAPPRTDVKDVMPIADHPDISVTVDPIWLKRATEFKKMLITDKSIVMIKGQNSALHVISCEVRESPRRRSAS